MAGYTGRKGPNVSQYLSNLNAIPSEHDLATRSPEGFDFINELSTFTNTEFLDYDQGSKVYHPTIDYDHLDGLNSADSAVAQDVGKSEELDFSFQSLEPFFNPDPSLNLARSTLQTNFPHQTSLASPTAFNQSPAPGTKRTASAASPASNFSQDDASRLAAEEDKRRRNTAASARFRVKKKQREQALEKAAKELNDKTASLEQRIGQLQTENEWLKNLITEKRGKEYLAEEWKAFKRRANSESESEKESNRSTEPRKKGVGTA
ncbi:MAG: hypothetical protein Q9182_000322 [Xanthomendoza sp. 2 TL-2023]